MASSSQQSQLFDGHFTVLDDTEFHIRARTLFFIVTLCTVVLLVTVFLLYARWVCHYYPNSSSSSSSSNAQPNAPPQSQPKGLDPAVIRALPIVLYQQSDRDLEADGGGECCICLGVFGDGEKVKVLPSCSHCYHSECVDAWLVTRSSCPLCRAQLRAQSSSS